MISQKLIDVTEFELILLNLNTLELIYLIHHEHFGSKSHAPPNYQTARWAVERDINQANCLQ